MKKLLLAVAFAFSFSTTAFADDDVKAVWKSKCKSCHGETGKGDTKQGKKEKVRDMTTDKWQTEWTDEKIKDIILNGSKDNDKMKPFKDKLSAAEVDGLVKLIRSFKK